MRTRTTTTTMTWRGFRPQRHNFQDSSGITTDEDLHGSWGGEPLTGPRLWRHDTGRPFT